jgi:hypothetical protein
MVYCPGCGALLTNTQGFTECGGEGEGVCAETIYALDLCNSGPAYALAEWRDLWSDTEPPDAHHADVIVRAHTVAGSPS